jgi:FtsH-binding integral membrane protein
MRRAARSRWSAPAPSGSEEPVHDEPALSRRTQPARRAGPLDEGLRRHMLGIYRTMALGLLLTGSSRLLVASTPRYTARSSARRSNGW